MTPGVERQVNLVQRRLFLTSFLSCLGWCWLTASLLGAAWLALQPALVEGIQDWLGWSVLGGLLAVGTAVAAFWAARETPGPVSAALSLDEKFGLKERATTAMTLAPESAQTPVGRALLADAESKVAGLDVGSRFPLRVPRSAALLPLGAVAVLLALYLPAWFKPGTPEPQEQPPEMQAKAEVAEKKRKLAQLTQGDKDKAEEGKKQDFEEIDARLDRFRQSPTDTPEEAKKAVQEAMALEEAMKKKQKELADRAEAVKNEMKRQARLKNKKRDEKGPEGKLDEALARGDLQDAANELKRLTRRVEHEAKKDRLKDKLNDPKANEAEKKAAREELDRLEREQNMQEKDRKEIERQMAKMEERLNDLKKDKEERKKEVDELEKEGKIDKDEADRQKKEIDDNDQKLNDQDKKDAGDLAKKVGECKKCLGEGKNGEAAKKMKEAAEKAGKMGGDKGQDGLAKRMAAVREVKKALCRAAGGQGVGAGQRPLAKEGETGKEEKFSPSDTSRGRLEVVGDGPNGGFKGPRTPQEMKEVLRKAAQEAPAALDRQRLPPAARKMARGYFEKLRQQGEKDAKKP